MLVLGNLSIYGKGPQVFLYEYMVEKVELVTEENKKSLVGAAGWAAAGTLLLGPLGLIAGALIGGNKKEVTFVCYLKEGKKFMAVADIKIYQKLLAYCF